MIQYHTNPRTLRFKMEVKIVAEKKKIVAEKKEIVAETKEMSSLWKKRRL